VEIRIKKKERRGSLLDVRSSLGLERSQPGAFTRGPVAEFLDLAGDRSDEGFLNIIDERHRVNELFEEFVGETTKSFIREILGVTKRVFDEESEMIFQDGEESDGVDDVFDDGGFEIIQFGF
jgi:hypothetical protein